MGCLPERKELKQNKWALRMRINYQEKLLEQLERNLQDATYPVKIRVIYPKTDNADCQKQMNEISKQARNDMTETLIKDHEIKLVADKESLEKLLTDQRRERRESLKKLLAIQGKKQRQKPYERKKRGSRRDILSPKKMTQLQMQAELVDLKTKYSQLQTELVGLNEQLSSKS